MPAKTYQIMLNNEQGRKEDFYKQSGTRSAFLDDPYVANPNLPVVTEAMIRQFIREAFKQKVPLFDPVSQDEIDALRQTGRQDADVSHLSDRQRSNLEILDQSKKPQSINQTRNLYTALGSTEPEISVEQEQDFLDAQDDYLVDLQNYNIEHALEDVFINGNRDPKLLKQLGFVSTGSGLGVIQTEMFDYYLNGVKPILNKPEFEIRLVKDTSRFFYSIKHFLDNHKHFPNHRNGLFKVYNKKASITDVIATQSFAVGTMIDGADTIFI